MCTIWWAGSFEQDCLKPQIAQIPQIRGDQQGIPRIQGHRMSEKTERDPRTFAIIGAGFEVHKTLGGGFLEAAYGDALAVEFAAREIPFDRERELPIIYKGRRLPTACRADFVCYGEIIVEIKALGRLSPVEEAQVINYLKASEFELGLLLNFGPKSMEQRRLVNSKSAKSAKSAVPT
jgi:GxxExxY protein